MHGWESKSKQLQSLPGGTDSGPDGQAATKHPLLRVLLPFSDRQRVCMKDNIGNLQSRWKHSLPTAISAGQPEAHIRYVPALSCLVVTDSHEAPTPAFGNSSWKSVLVLRHVSASSASGVQDEDDTLLAFLQAHAVPIA
jgi:hypothetical protein